MTKLVSSVALLTTLFSLSAGAQIVGTFTLDGLSFVSFGDDQIVYLPAGSTIKFNFGVLQSDGSASFTINPGDVAMSDVSLRSGGVLRYSMPSPASGTIQPKTDGRLIQFTGTVRATLETGTAIDGSYDYSIRFTTEATSASNIPRTETLSVNGMRLVDGAWYGQIVGATTNKENAFPEPGTAVYTVLSGSFDQVP